MEASMEVAGKLISSLWGCISLNVVRIVQLESKVDLLESENKKLKAKYEDISEKIKGEEAQPHTRRLKGVEDWLKEAKKLTEDACQIVERGKNDVQSRFLWGQCPRNCLSSYKIMTKVEKTLGNVTKMFEEGEKFVNLTSTKPFQMVEEQPLEKPVIGFDTILADAWRWIDDEDNGVRGPDWLDDEDDEDNRIVGSDGVDDDANRDGVEVDDGDEKLRVSDGDNDNRIIGLYGVGGVGKTTLLKMINNEFINRKRDSKLVIWVSVKQEDTVEDVQCTIRTRVALKDDNWNQKRTDQKANMILKFLKEKQFVLLLDNLWKGLNLSEIGIPDTGKIVFTTRLLRVCREMNAQKKIKVVCLNPTDAKALFRVMVRKETLKFHPDIPYHAQDIIKMCRGLPIALKTIGRAMSGKKDPEEWKRSKRDLIKKSLSSDVYPLLKLSYDCLGDRTFKECFLYCAIFPQGYNIYREDLIKCWFDEGLIRSESKEPKEEEEEEEASSSMLLEDEVVRILETLTDACLLEKVYETYVVKMHDVIRDMALWIAREEKKSWNSEASVKFLTFRNRWRNRYERNKEYSTYKAGKSNLSSYRNI